MTKWLRRLPWWGWLIGLLIMGGLLALAIWKWGFWTTLLIPAYGAGVILRESFKAGGAKPVSQDTGARPTFPGGISAESPKPKEGEKRARSRRNNWR